MICTSEELEIAANKFVERVVGKGISKLFLEKDFISRE